MSIGGGAQRPWTEQVGLYRTEMVPVVGGVRLALYRYGLAASPPPTGTASGAGPHTPTAGSSSDARGAPDMADAGAGAGDLPGMLLVHGLASNARLWDGVASWLRSAGHAVAAVDQRGHGHSDKPDSGYDFGTVCRDLVAVLDHLQREEPGPWRRPVVVGQSWGGNVVLELAWRHPQRVSAVACVDGGTIELAEEYPTWESAREALAPPRLAGLEWSRFEAVIRSAHPGWPESGIRGTLANVERRPDGTIAPWLHLEHHLAILRSLYEEHPSAHYGEITTPVLLIPALNGDEARRARKRASLQRAVDALPSGALRWFEGDHDLHAQFPEELAQVLHRARWEGMPS